MILPTGSESARHPAVRRVFSLRLRFESASVEVAIAKAAHSVPPPGRNVVVHFHCSRSCKNCSIRPRRIHAGWIPAGGKIRLSSITEPATQQRMMPIRDVYYAQGGPPAVVNNCFVGKESCAWHCPDQNVDFSEVELAQERTP